MRPFLALLCVLCLSACATGTSAIVETFKLVSNNGIATVPLPTQTGLTYLHVEANTGTAFMVLGYFDHGTDGATEVWYSNAGQVVKLHRGRIVATAGLTTDWREVRFSSLPDWPQTPGQILRYRRSRDEMPGYRFGIDETLLLRAIDAPPDIALTAPAGTAVRWFEERIESPAPDALPPSLYAVDLTTGRTLYGRQCLAANLCLTWQPWVEGKH